MEDITHTQITITLSLRKNVAPKISDAENILGKDILFMSISMDRNSYAPTGLRIFLMLRTYSATIPYSQGSTWTRKLLLPRIFSEQIHLTVMISKQFLGGLSLHLNHLIAERVSAPYWQFGTLPIGIFLSNLVSGQLETSLMTSSYDILLSLLKFVNFWQLQGRLSILAKIGCLQKIKVFLMKERQGFNVTWGF